METGYLLVQNKKNTIYWVIVNTAFTDASHDSQNLWVLCEGVRKCMNKGDSVDIVFEGFQNLSTRFIPKGS